MKKRKWNICQVYGSIISPRSRHQVVTVSHILSVIFVVTKSLMSVIFMSTRVSHIYSDWQRRLVN